MLRIKDVARVEIGAQNMDSESRIDGNPGALITYRAWRQRGDHRAKAAQNTLADCPSAPAGAGLYRALSSDPTTFVSDTIKEVL